MTNAKEHPASPPQGVVILAAEEMQSEETTPCQLCQTGAGQAEHPRHFTLQPVPPAASPECCSQQRLSPSLQGGAHV